MTKRRFPDPPDEWDPTWAAELVRALNQESSDNSQPDAAGWSVTNFTATRSLNAGTATLQNVKDFVATLVSDLLAVGKLKD